MTRQWYKCYVKGCRFEHSDGLQLKLHEAMEWHCLACGKSELEAERMNINKQGLCDKCTSEILWADQPATMEV